MSTRPFPIRSAPGVQRDGTRLAGKACVDALWCRWQRNLPRKIGGYQATTDTLPEKTYGMTSYSTGGTLYQHHGSISKVTQVRTNHQGNFLGLSDRTPGGSFNPHPDNLWQFDHIISPSGLVASVVAHPGQNLTDIDNDVETPVFWGEVNGTGNLTQTLMDPVSGGILVLYPYLLAFSNAGRVDVSDLEDLTVVPPFSGFVTGQKIIRGLSLRGGGGGPAGLLWSLDSLIRATFNSDPAGEPFAYDTIADDISVLSSRGIIADMGIYYWPGVDTWYLFNGVVREIPNDMNANFFFDNLNYTHRQKVFAFKVPRFGEIWWCFPKGSATECNHAVVYNRRENFWFDTPLPNSGRSDGLFAKVYQKPFLTGLDLTDDDEYLLWQHETGTDEIYSGVRPIRSYFETGNITLLTTQEPQDASLRIDFMEPDFVQTGDLTLTVTGEANSRAGTVSSATKTFPPGPTTPDDQVVRFKDGVRRVMRFKFESNTAGGNYEMGECMGHLEPNDGRITG